jgi:hypothetical protein
MKVQLGIRGGSQGHELHANEISFFFFKRISAFAPSITVRRAKLLYTVYSRLRKTIQTRRLYGGLLVQTTDITGTSNAILNQTGDDTFKAAL